MTEPSQPPKIPVHGPQNPPSARIVDEENNEWYEDNVDHFDEYDDYDDFALGATHGANTGRSSKGTKSSSKSIYTAKHIRVKEAQSAKYRK